VLPRAAVADQGHLTVRATLTRADLERAVASIVAASLDVCLQAVDDAGINPNDIDQLLATGGMSRIPAVRRAAERFFGTEAVEDPQPEHAVVVGAALHAAALSGVPVRR
jgi:molecular chaperone DnaK